MNESPRLRVLALVPGRRDAARPLLEYLEASKEIELQVAGELDEAPPLDGHAAVLALSAVPLSAERERELTGYVRRGGGLVTLHATLPGSAPLGRAPVTELRVRLQPGHSLTDRLDGEFLITDELLLADDEPERATVLARAAWRYEEIPVAYALEVGSGRHVQIGLGGTPRALQTPILQRLVYRSLRHAAGVEPAPTIGVGLVGYGAIAHEHAEAIHETLGLDLKAVCDRAGDRREAAQRRFSIPTYNSARAMLDDPAVELVVVGTPPNAHAPGVIEALEADRHVVCEKPFAIHTEEVDRMLATAAARGRVLTVYQSRRWDPDFVAVRDALRSGRIGELFYMESFIGGYSHPCSYWHSHEPISGGTIYDWGSHYFDWILQLFAGRRVTGVSAGAHKRVWMDVTNADQVRVELRFDDGSEASFLQSDIAAALKPKWYLLGTEGAIRGDWRNEPVPADWPALVSIHGQDGSVQQLALPERERHGFYRNLADHLLQGEPLAVRPEEARRNVAVMEAATRSIAAGGKLVEVDI